MTELKIDNSECTLSNLPIDQFSKLKEILSYTPQQNPSQRLYRPVKRYLINKRGIFPTGLLPYVREFLKDQSISYQEIDLRRAPMPQKRLFSLRLGVTPYDEQKSIVEACKHRGIVSAVTGFGKSVAIALLIEKLQVKTLIVVPNLALKQQLTQTFKSYFGNLDNITIENIDSKKLEKAHDYDCLIIDEAHHVAAHTYRNLNSKVWKGIYYRFYFTATPFRSRTEEQLLFEGVAGQIIYQIGYREAQSKGYVTPIEAYYLEIPKIEYQDYFRYSNAYKDLIVNHDIRNHIIATCVHRLNEAKVSTLCLLKEVQHGEIIKDLAQVAFAKGENENNRELILEFNLQERYALVGTTGVIGEGVDTKPCEYVIIATPIKSKNLFMQCVGRSLRRYNQKSSAKIILIKDTSHRWFKSAFKEQVKILAEEYGVTPKKIEINS